MSNYTSTNVGKWDSLESEVFEKGPLRKSGKVFLGETLQTSGCEISVNRIAPGDGYNFLHRHQRNEEVYVVVSGRGEMVIDGESLSLCEGSVIRVSPSGARSLRAAPDESLQYICIQAPTDGEVSRDVTDGVMVSDKVQWSEG